MEIEQKQKKRGRTNPLIGQKDPGQTCNQGIQTSYHFSLIQFFFNNYSRYFHLTLFFISCFAEHQAALDRKLAYASRELRQVTVLKSIKS